MWSRTSERRRQTGRSGIQDFRTFYQTRLFGFFLAFSSLLIIALYVFLLTDYPSCLYSDMHGFWERALQRLDGNPYDISQYFAWPPGYHIFLAEFFRVLKWLGLSGLIKLETVLAMNILAHAVSVYALQRVAVRWFQQTPWGLAALLLYGFGFPAWYFNAFLLSENLAIPLLVIAVSLIYRREGWMWLILSALLFAFASIIRPSLAPYGLAFVVYLLIRRRFSLAFVARAAVFSTLFFALILGAGLEVSRISQGRVTGLSANGGLDFFIANARYHRIELSHEGLNHFIVVPALSQKPEQGYFKTNVPFYDQGYYYQLGWNFIKHHPERLLKNFAHVKDLFFATMLPAMPIPGYDFFRPLWDGFKFLMFVSLWLYLWMWRGLSPEEKPLCGFLMTVIGLTLLVSYLFTGEPRYSYAIIFAFYLLFFKLAELFYGDWRRWRKVLLPYGLTMGLIIGVSAAVVVALEPQHSPSMKMHARSLNSAPAGASTVQDVGRLFFPFARKGVIAHADTGYKPSVPTRVWAITRLDIAGREPLALRFDVYSVWPFEMLINGKTLLAEKNPYDLSANQEDPGGALEKSVEITLDPGRHTLEMAFDFIELDGGFAVNYSYEDASGWRHRNMVGVSDERVRFTLPKEGGQP